MGRLLRLAVRLQWRRQNRAISRPTYQSALLEAHATTPEYMRGVHFTGGDQCEEGRHHNNNSGVYNTDYWYPGIARDANTGLSTFESLVTRRIRLVRLPFRWELIQPTLNGALSTAQLQRYKASVRSTRSQPRLTVTTRRRGKQERTRLKGTVANVPLFL